MIDVAMHGGSGPVTLAALLTEAAGPISRRDYTALRTLSGVAPVTKRSGKSCIVIMSYAARSGCATLSSTGRGWLC